MRHIAIGLACLACLQLEIQSGSFLVITDAVDVKQVQWYSHTVINFVFVTGRRSLSLLLTITEITRPVRMYYGSGTADGVASEQQSIYCMQEHMQRPPRGRCV